MSTALVRLREYFDDQLLVPIGRSMTLTPLAQSFVQPVRDIVLRARALIEQKPDFDPLTIKRKVTIMASDYVAATFLPRLLLRLASEAPGISCQIVSHVEQQLAPLELGHVDLLIIPERYVSAAHPSAPIFSDDYVCIA